MILGANPCPCHVVSLHWGVWIMCSCVCTCASVCASCARLPVCVHCRGGSECGPGVCAAARGGVVPWLLIPQAQPPFPQPQGLPFKGSELLDLGRGQALGHQVSGLCSP